MSQPADLNPTIIESLYCDALLLADEARTAFDLSGRLEAASLDEDLARIALSCEALRTTTLMMHAITWLLNQRAHLAGELTEFQLRRHGRLPTSQSEPDPMQLALLGEDLVELIQRTRRFYARIERLDTAWRAQFAMEPSAVHRLHARIGQAVGGLR
jgi:regulator of CtrA degradation